MKQKRQTTDHETLEEGKHLLLDFYKLDSLNSEKAGGLIPVVVQNADTGEVLILAYANPDAVEESLKRRVAVFYSTSRNELWIKGSTSGDYLDLVEIRVNCEQNSLLYLVRPRKTGVCHTRDETGHTRPSCYYRRLENEQKNDESVTLLPASRKPLPWHGSSE